MESACQSVECGLFLMSIESACLSVECWPFVGEEEGEVNYGFSN